METEIAKQPEIELPLEPARVAPRITAGEVVPWLFALAITGAEMIVTLVNVRTGMLLHVLVLLALLGQASLVWYRDSRAAAPVDDTESEFLARGTPGYRFYIALTLAPIIRIISLATPMWNFPMMYWYLITGAPLLLTAFVIIRVAGYRPDEVCLRLGRDWQQAGVALVGVALGWLEFQILRPQSLLPGDNAGLLVLAGFILLVFTGFVEEIIFRGVMLRAADDYLGKTHSMIYGSFIFAVLHIIHFSFLDVVFVFGVAVLFTFFVRRTGSLLGVTLAHGITNIMLYLVCPLLLLH